MRVERFAKYIGRYLQLCCCYVHAAGHIFTCSLGTMIRDLTLPILSLFTGISFSQAMSLCTRCLPSLTPHMLSFCFLQAVRQALGGSVSIEDLLVPFFCISTNLSQLDQEVRSSIYGCILVVIASNSQ